MAMDVKYKRFVFLALFAIIIASLWSSGVLDYLSLDTIKNNRDALLAFVDAHAILSIPLFMAIYIGIVVFSLPVASIMTLMGGFLFGSLIGGAVVVISATIGATILFLIAKTALGQSLRDKAGPYYKKIAHEMEENAVQYMLFMRLAPIMPFFIANILPSLFRVKTRDYILTTMIGIIPGTFVYAYLGRNLGTIETLSDLVSRDIIFGLFGLGFLSLIPVIIKKIRRAS